MYNKNIYELLEYGKFLKREVEQLNFDLENSEEYDLYNIKSAIKDVRDEIKVLNKYLKKTDNFHPEDFLPFVVEYLNQCDYKYVYSKITMFDHNNYGAKNHYFISDEATAEYLNENINCEYDFNNISKAGVLKDIMHFEEGKFSLIDSNYDLNKELCKKKELIYPIYHILQMKLDNPYIFNEQRMDIALNDIKKGINK